MLSFLSGRRRFADLSEREVLALAVSSEEDDARIYMEYAEALRSEYPDTAKVFESMAAQERGHQTSLTREYERRYGGTVPLIRRESIAGYYGRRPVWAVVNLGIERIRAEVGRMEDESASFYLKAQEKTSDPGTRKLLESLYQVELQHEEIAGNLADRYLPADKKKEEDEKARRQFLLTFVQPGLAGLMDGSVSTLAPIFATAFATQNSHTTLLVGLAAAVGAGISMGFTEALHDDGVISGRGSPLKRGLSSGIMTAVGGLGHALPYIIPEFWTATAIAIIVVFIELWAIAFIQNRYMETPFWRSVFQIVLGGALVLAAGIFIGGS
ncbi:iron exporter MbfA [Xanthobacter sp. YC-JY1]|uniref:iron exporter MbfA n=1 Tax=Xanthobacter sp. YC-JY1 TaxID=2419844 RepID=UPI001AC9EB0D|nr:ferritin family protein [Xanthobacter sp. YC-JY1]MBN8919031.1 VIT1/CCC1 transporter family protein [Hyphomicrobiales bacterium]UJX43687.1 rubrerythrin family protein [Xanthobacter sp. YC-JY1]